MPITNIGTSGSLDVYVEYYALKQEQLSRITDRDHLLYANLVAVATIAGYYLEHSEHYQVLLALPIVSFVLGALHFSNDVAIASIGRYVSAHLRTMLSTDGQKNQNAFAWEEHHRSDPVKRVTKLFDKIAIAIAFILPGVGGLGILQFSRPLHSAIEWTIIIGDSILLLALILTLFLNHSKSSR